MNTLLLIYAIWTGIGTVVQARMYMLQQIKVGYAIRKPGPITNKKAYRLLILFSWVLILFNPFICLANIVFAKKFDKILQYERGKRFSNDFSEIEIINENN
jgi:hypothetical protein